MTEMASEAQEPIEQQASEPPVETPTEGGNPAWQEFLDVLPTQLHSVVRPVLEKWDKGVQDRFQSIHNEYEPYKAYAPVVDAEIPLETINTALRILNGLEQNPQKVYEAIGQYYNFTSATQGQTPQVEEDGDEEFTGEYVDPRIAELQEKFDSLSKILYDKFSLEQQQQQDAALAAELGRLTKQYGAFDENFVLSQMLQDVSPEDAVKNYHSLVESIKAEAMANGTKPQAPKVLGAGGGSVASQAVDPNTLSDSDTRKLVAQMLERAKRSG